MRPTVKVEAFVPSMRQPDRQRLALSWGLRAVNFGLVRERTATAKTNHDGDVSLA